MSKVSRPAERSLLVYEVPHMREETAVSDSSVRGFGQSGWDGNAPPNSSNGLCPFPAVCVAANVDRRTDRPEHPQVKALQEVEPGCSF